MNSFDLRAKRPLIISGPCSAETEEQTLDTCRRLAATGKIDVLRAGIWKPRTNPGSFEGVGLKGLAWMAKAKQETGLPIAIEVASAKHVESACEFDVDIMWIGARTTVSPFSIQEIANALKRSDKTVLIKNPMNPDIDLWSGAVARMLDAGVEMKNIGLIHRGFSYIGHNRFRNTPMWHLILEMRNRFPEIPIICDPSHICGCVDYLQEVAQQAADLRFDGLMMESHNCPSQAWSDAAQQLLPEDMGRLVDSIKWRADSVDSPAFLNALNGNREAIDQIDAELFDLLSRRMRIADKIGLIKRDNNVAILQGSRWGSIVDRVITQSQELNLSEEFVKTVLEAIHLESINRQNSIMNNLK